MEATKITRDELAANLAAIMERVRVHREYFSVVDGEEVVAELGPGPKRFTVADFRREFGNDYVPEELGRSIAEGRQLIWTGAETPWYMDDGED